MRLANLLFVFTVFTLHSPAKLQSVTHESPFLTRSDSGYRDRSADAVDKLHQQYEASPYKDDAKPEPARSEPDAGTHSAAASSRYVSGEE